MVFRLYFHRRFSSGCSALTITTSRLNKIEIKNKLLTYYRSHNEYFEKLDCVFAERGRAAYKRGRFDILTYVIDASCVLDVGCGSGALLAFLRELYPEKQYYGIDISPLAIAKANEKNNVSRSPIMFAVADIEKTVPFGTEVFDFVIAHEVLEHFVNPDKAIMNLAKAMKKGGMFFLLAPNLLVRSSPITIAAKALDYLKMLLNKKYLNLTIVDPPLDKVGGDSDAVYVTNPWELHRMLRHSGFEILKKSHIKCRLVARKM